MRPVLLFTLRLLAPSMIIMISRDASQASATTTATASLFATNKRHDPSLIHPSNYLQDDPRRPFGGDQMSSKSSRHKQQKKKNKK